MKALSLIQPWAIAIMLGHKKIETRSWNTKFRGRIAIHASKGQPKYAKEFALSEFKLGFLPEDVPLGAIIGFATIIDTVRTESLSGQISEVERRYGDYSEGRWAWKLDDIVPLSEDKLIWCKGALGLWEVPPEIESRF